MKISKIKKRWKYTKWMTAISMSLSGSVENSLQNRLKRSRCRVRRSCPGKRLWAMSRRRRKWRHYKDFGWLTSYLEEMCLWRYKNYDVTHEGWKLLERFSKMVSRTDFLVRRFLVRTFSKGISIFKISRKGFSKKLMWWQANKPAGKWPLLLIAIQALSTNDLVEAPVVERGGAPELVRVGAGGVPATLRAHTFIFAKSIWKFSKSQKCLKRTKIVSKNIILSKTENLKSK